MDEDRFSQHFSNCWYCGLPIGDQSWVFKIVIDDGRSVVVPVHVDELKG